MIGRVDIFIHELVPMDCPVFSKSDFVPESAYYLGALVSERLNDNED
jgi:hypothetical protein